MRSIRNAVLGCAAAAGIQSAFAYSTASANALLDSLDGQTVAALAAIVTLVAGDLPEAQAWAKFAAPLAAKFK